MAIINVTKKPAKIHKLAHKCFRGNSFLQGFYSLGNFCPICGESLLEDGENITYKCSECGQLLVPIKQAYNYCDNCGVKFTIRPASFGNDGGDKP